MDLEKRQQRPEQPEGCLTVAIRIPVRIVVLLVVVPLRMVWDLLVVCGRVLERVLLRPLGRALEWLYEAVLAPVGRAIARGAEVVAMGAWWLFKAVFYWPWVALWRYVVVPVATYGIAVPLAWLYRAVLTPVGRGLARILGWVYVRLLTPLGRGIGWLVWAVFVWPWTALYRWVLTPLGHGLAWVYAYVLAPAGRGLWNAVVWLARILVVAPARFVYRWILTPVGRALVVVGREIGDALVVAWRVAGYVSRAVGRALKWLARNLLGRPAAWFYRNVCTPVGHFVRDQVWAPARRAAVEAGQAVRGALSSARETLRQARRDAWRALVGGAPAPEPVEPALPRARNLEHTQQTPTVPGAEPGPEISLRKWG
ncbi:hypothetical protein ACWCXB_06405 [Streptomyces sp. NPDC001514]